MENKQTNTSRRGRPPRSQEQITANRNVIIQAARDLFAAHGYEGVSMRKIAAQADCLPATLYTLFPNKRQLLHHIWEVIFLDLIIELEQCYNNSPESARLEKLGEFKHEVRQFEKSYDNQQAEQISLMV